MSRSNRAPRRRSRAAAELQRPTNIQRTFVQHSTVVQHNVVQPNAIQRPAPNNVRPVNPNPDFNPNFNPNLNRNPGPIRTVAMRSNSQSAIQQPAEGDPARTRRNAAERGRGRPRQRPQVGARQAERPPNVRLGPGPGGFPPGSGRISRSSRPTTGSSRSPADSVSYGGGGYRRTFVPLAALGVVLIGGFLLVSRRLCLGGPALCAGLTPDGCQLNWRMVDFEDGGGVPQCVQYCPQVGAASGARRRIAAAAASGAGQRYLRDDDLRRSEFRRHCRRRRRKTSPPSARPDGSTKSHRSRSSRAPGNSMPTRISAAPRCA